MKKVATHPPTTGKEEEEAESESSRVDECMEWYKASQKNQNGMSWGYIIVQYKFPRVLEWSDTRTHTQQRSGSDSRNNTQYFILCTPELC